MRSEICSEYCTCSQLEVMMLQGRDLLTILKIRAKKYRLVGGYFLNY